MKNDILEEVKEIRKELEEFREAMADFMDEVEELKELREGLADIARDILEEKDPIKIGDEVITKHGGIKFVVTEVGMVDTVDYATGYPGGREPAYSGISEDGSVHSCFVAEELEKTGHRINYLMVYINAAFDSLCTTAYEPKHACNGCNK